MKNIAFIDTEVDVKSKRILDIGVVTDNGVQIHSNSTADCYVLFDEEDLSKHFILLNQTKLNIKEIQ